MSTLRLRLACVTLGLVVSSLWSLSAMATFHLWQISEVYSNASGTVQYIEFATTAAGEEFLTGHAITVKTAASMYTPSMQTSFTFPSDLPGDSANRHFLVATQGFASLGIVTPDYVVPNGFLLLPAATINYASVDSVTYASLPSDGTHAMNRTGTEVVNSPTNFAGQSGSVPAATESASLLENPAAGSFQSGVGLVSGWSCTPGVSVGVDGGTAVSIPYGSSRGDTAGACGAGNTNTGFGFLLNYNLLGAGPHTAQLFVGGQPQGSPTPFTVTVPAGEFLSGVTKQVTVTDFPVAGKTTVLIWQQSQQNFAVMSVSP
ncbi:MAG TPA: hypothetical protein VGR63_15640 [Casimicrobiaceae bacterium]|jgi:hypothetical protein|nr:hypothetical protein [Casimicrobiaceae bacterium]